MAVFIQEQQIVNNNAFLYEEKITSQYTKFLDKPPTFVTYFRVNNIETMADIGYDNVEAILGPRSPIRYNKIEDFPIYGFTKVDINLDDDEEGLTTSYDSEAYILPNTITPNVHDFFIVNHYKEPILFMVTEIGFHTIKSNGYHRINFTMKSLSLTALERLDKQVTDCFNCIFKNIGTEDKCLVRTEDYQKIQDFLTKFDEISDKYLMLFYDEKTNSLVYQDEYCKLYDSYLTEFIIRNKIFQNPHDYKSLVLYNEDKTRKFPLNYEKSIYRSIEKKDKSRLPYRCTFIRSNFESGESCFTLRRKHNTLSIQFDNEHKYHEYQCTGEIYISTNLLHCIKLNKFIDHNVSDNESSIMPINDSVPSTPVIPPSYIPSIPITPPTHIPSIPLQPPITNKPVPPSQDESIDIDNGMNADVLINPIHTIIVKYFNNVNNGLFDEEMAYIDADDINDSFDSFITTIILLYIMRVTYKNFIKH